MSQKWPQMTSNQKITEQRPQLKFDYSLTLDDLNKKCPKKRPQMTSNQKITEQRPQLKFDFTYKKLFGGQLRSFLAIFW